MDNFAHPMHIVKSNETLPRQFSRKRHGNTLVIVSLDDLKEVDSENLKDHHKMLAVGSMMDK